jgi:hypothetical protein
MHLVSAAAVEFLSDTPALRSPNATLIGQALSSGRLPACSWPAPPNPAAAAPCSRAVQPAAGETAPPEVRRCQEPGAIRRARAPATSAPVRLFDSARRNAYAQSTDTQSVGPHSTDTNSTGARPRTKSRQRRLALRTAHA